jgi:hypothetical protein
MSLSKHVSPKCLSGVQLSFDADLPAAPSSVCPGEAGAAAPVGQEAWPVSPSPFARLFIQSILWPDPKYVAVDGKNSKMVAGNHHEMVMTPYSSRYGKLSFS